MWVTSRGDWNINVVNLISAAAAAAGLQFQHRQLTMDPLRHPSPAGLPMYPSPVLGGYPDLPLPPGLPGICKSIYSQLFPVVALFVLDLIQYLFLCLYLI